MIINQILAEVVGFTAGGVIGLAFGIIQQAAYRRYQRRQAEGKFDTGWAVMPGSMRRVAYLLVALALVQLICPMIFKDGTQWWVSGGVVAGYGWMLYRNLREKLATRH